MRLFQGMPTFSRITRVSQTGMFFEEKQNFNFDLSNRRKSRNIGITLSDGVKVNGSVSFLDRNKPPISELERIGPLHIH